MTRVAVIVTGFGGLAAAVRLRLRRFRLDDLDPASAVHGAAAAAGRPG